VTDRTMDPEKEADEGRLQDSQPPTEDDRAAALAEVRQKAEAILDACGRRDLDRLRTLAEDHGGLLNDELRRKACQ
jgi:DNA-binding FadR family transcriptional regulator